MLAHCLTKMLIAEILQVYILRKVTALYRVNPLEEANLQALFLVEDEKKKRRLLL